MKKNIIISALVLVTLVSGAAYVMQRQATVELQKKYELLDFDYQQKCVEDSTLRVIMHRRDSINTETTKKLFKLAGWVYDDTI